LTIFHKGNAMDLSPVVTSSSFGCQKNMLQRFKSLGAFEHRLDLAAPIVAPSANATNVAQFWTVEAVCGSKP